MKNNFLKVAPNDLNVQLTFIPRPPLAIKLVLIAMCLMIFMAPWILIFQAEEQKQGLIFLGTLVFYTFMYFMLGRYTLWNLLGEERLIISSKAINFQHHYGFFNTPWKAKRFNNIYIGFSQTHEVEGKKYGKLDFITDNENGIHEMLYSTSIIVSEEEINVAIENIDKLFIEDSMKPFGMIHEN